MRYLEFRDKFSDFIVFTQRQIKQLEPDFNDGLLYRWQKKGYIKKICKGHYIFCEQKIDELILFHLANKIYEPSYISMEQAFSYYNLIPETVYGITSISTKKTQIIKSSVATFYYNNLKPDLFWGYKLISYDGINIKIAEIEKCILDYLKLKAHINSTEQFRGLRIDLENLRKQVDLEKFYSYLDKFKNKTLNKKVKNFIKAIDFD